MEHGSCYIGVCSIFMFFVFYKAGRREKAKDFGPISMRTIDKDGDMQSLESKAVLLIGIRGLVFKNTNSTLSHHRK